MHSAQFKEEWKSMGEKMKRKEEKVMMRDFPTTSKLHLFHSW